jgi:hypothetical protein
MRQVTRRVVIAILVVLGLLLALGALPSLLRTGDPYYLTATPTTENHSAVNFSRFPTRRYPYANTATNNATNATGWSQPYWKGPFGLKEGFSHSPFDEVDAIAARAPNATDRDAVYLSRNGTIYRLEVTQDGPP